MVNLESDRPTARIPAQTAENPSLSVCRDEDDTDREMCIAAMLLVADAGECDVGFAVAAQAEVALTDHA